MCVCVCVRRGGGFVGGVEVGVFLLCICGGGRSGDWFIFTVYLCVRGVFVGGVEFGVFFIAFYYSSKHVAGL